MTSDTTVDTPAAVTAVGTDTATPTGTAAGPSTRADGRGVTFVLPDPDHTLTAVRLWQEVRIPGDRLDLAYADGMWTRYLERPAVDRMEYLFEVTGTDGGHGTTLDPGNPLQVGGAFGEHSVIEFPGYQQPSWLAQDPPPGRYTELDIDADLPMSGRLWAPDGLADDEPAPLLVVHDGPEYDQLAALTRFLSTLAAQTRGIPVRAALLAPGEGTRDERYAANPAYSRTLTRTVVPALREAAPSTAVIGVGASLGALAVLVAQRGAPRTFDGLFLQSGSYFRTTTDPQERRFAHFGRVNRAIAGILAAAGARHPVPVAMTCGGIEENLANNRAMARALRAQGYPLTFAEVRDVHNYTAWRDAFEPYLRDLLTTVAAAQ